MSELRRETDRPYPGVALFPKTASALEVASTLADGLVQAGSWRRCLGSRLASFGTRAREGAGRRTSLEESMAQPLATTAIRTAKDTRPTVDVEASSRHCLDDVVHGCILRSSLLKVASHISVRITRAPSRPRETRSSSTPPSRSPRIGGALGRRRRARWRLYSLRLPYAP